MVRAGHAGSKGKLDPPGWGGRAIEFRLAIRLSHPTGHPPNRADTGLSIPFGHPPIDWTPTKQRTDWTPAEPTGTHQQ
jgi:hypothetical protein